MAAPRRRQALLSLEGRVVMVTRAAEQASELAVELERRGATAVLAPAIRLVRTRRGTLDHAVDELLEGGFAWVLFTSRAGVNAVVEALSGRGLKADAIPAQLAAVGEGTARALRRAGAEPSIVPQTYTTFALSRAMPRGSGRVLLPRADIATGELEGAMSAKGWTPVRVDAYRTTLSRKMPGVAARALRAGQVDAVTFTSASTVDGFVQMIAHSPRLSIPKVVCIGPVTARRAQDHGLEVAGVARPHTIEGLIGALERVLHRPAGRRRLGSGGLSR